MANLNLHMVCDGLCGKTCSEEVLPEIWNGGLFNCKLTLGRRFQARSLCECWDTSKFRQTWTTSESCFCPACCTRWAEGRKKTHNHLWLILLKWNSFTLQSIWWRRQMWLQHYLTEYKCKAEIGAMNRNFTAVKRRNWGQWQKHQYIQAERLQPHELRQ